MTNEIWNVEPVDDLQPHSDDEFCKCMPRIDIQPDGSLLVVHNSYDGREKYESTKGPTSH